MPRMTAVRLMICCCVAVIEHGYGVEPTVHPFSFVREPGV